MRLFRTVSFSYCEKFTNIKKRRLHIACELVNRPLFYNHKDWFTGEVDRYNILQCLDIFESDETDNIKNNNFKIVLEKI